jgi:hypothetical protein
MVHSFAGFFLIINEPASTRPYIHVPQNIAWKEYAGIKKG